MLKWFCNILLPALLSGFGITIYFNSIKKWLERKKGWKHLIKVAQSNKWRQTNINKVFSWHYSVYGDASPTLMNVVGKDGQNMPTPAEYIPFLECGAVSMINNSYLMDQWYLTRFNKTQKINNKHSYIFGIYQKQ